MEPATTGSETNFFTTDPKMIELIEKQPTLDQILDENDVPTSEIIRDFEEGTPVNIGVSQEVPLTEWEQKKLKVHRPLRYLAIGTTRTVDRHIGRNDPCHCGSGLKYKKCCLKTELDEKG